MTRMERHPIDDMPRRTRRAGTPPRWRRRRPGRTGLRVDRGRRCSAARARRDRPSATPGRRREPTRKTPARRHPRRLTGVHTTPRWSHILLAEQSTVGGRKRMLNQFGLGRSVGTRLSQLGARSAVPLGRLCPTSTSGSVAGWVSRGRARRSPRRRLRSRHWASHERCRPD